MNKTPSEEQVKQILERHFPDVSVSSTMRINEGFTHYMYESVLDTKTVIIRVGYNENEEYSLGKEFWAMEAYKKAGIPVPSIYAIDTSRTEFPFEYMVMQKLPGQCLGQIWNALKPEEKKQVAF